MTGLKDGLSVVKICWPGEQAEGSVNPIRPFCFFVVQNKNIHIFFISDVIMNVFKIQTAINTVTIMSASPCNKHLEKLHFHDGGKIVDYRRTHYFCLSFEYEYLLKAPHRGGDEAVLTSNKNQCLEQQHGK